MSDAAIDVIAGVAPRRIGYRWYRSTFGADRGLKDSLAHGHAVIDTPEKLDQYLYSYGPMIESQWKNAAAYLAEISAPALLIDYGCGQGLAGLLANDLTPGKLLSQLCDILLIEPSSVALARATAVYRKLAPAATVHGVNRFFDAIRTIDLPAAPAGDTLHLFSNSLDVAGFRPLELLARTLRTGRHMILSVSHDRDFNGGSPQIESVKAAIEHPSMANQLAVHRSELARFTCDNPSQSKGLAWFCILEVKDG